MKRLLAVGAAALMLVGSQAVATTQLTPLDRAASPTGTENQLEGVGTIGWVVLAVFIAVVVAVAASDDPSSSP